MWERTLDFPQATATSKTCIEQVGCTPEIYWELSRKRRIARTTLSRPRSWMRPREKYGPVMYPDFLHAKGRSEVACSSMENFLVVAESIPHPTFGRVQTMLRVAILPKGHQITEVQRICNVLLSRNLRYARAGTLRVFHV